MDSLIKFRIGSKLRSQFQIRILQPNPIKVRPIGSWCQFKLFSVVIVANKNSVSNAAHTVESY